MKREDAMTAFFRGQLTLAGWPVPERKEQTWTGAKRPKRGVADDVQGNQRGRAGREAQGKGKGTRHGAGIEEMAQLRLSFTQPRKEVGSEKGSKGKAKVA